MDDDSKYRLGLSLYLAHLYRLISVQWLSLLGEKMRRPIYETPIATAEELLQLHWAMKISDTLAILSFHDNHSYANSIPVMRLRTGSLSGLFNCYFSTQSYLMISSSRRMVDLPEFCYTNVPLYRLYNPWTHRKQFFSILFINTQKKCPCLYIYHGRSPGDVSEEPVM